MSDFMSDFTLRTASQQDVAAIVALFQNTRKACMPYLPIMHSHSEDLAFFRGCVEREAVWVAQAGTVRGFCAYADGWLNHLYVSPDDQHRGIGAALLKIATDAQKVLDLWVFQQNVRAIKFYESYGFILVEQTDGSKNENRMADARYRRTIEK